MTLIPLHLIHLCLSGGSQQMHAKARFGEWGVETQHISRTILPGDDFFAYVNDGWIRSTKIPDGYWDYGQTSILSAETNRNLQKLVNQAREGKTPTDRLVWRAYQSFLNSERGDKLGLAPIRSDLDNILKIGTHTEVAKWMADPRSSSLVAINVYPDAGGGNRWLVHLDQANLVQPILGLGRETYVSQDVKKREDLLAYSRYIERIFSLAKIDRAAERAQSVLDIEARLAAKHWDLNQLRDRKANYHLLTIGQLKSYAPGFPWQTFLDERGVGKIKHIVLGTDTAVQAQAKIFRQIPAAQWANYLAFHWLQNQIEFLPYDFRRANFEFYGSRLSGQKEPRKRGDAALSFVNERLALAVGKLYALRHFSKASQKRALELAHFLKEAFADALESAEWMDKPTRAEAVAKLQAVKFKVGFPTIWRDYSHVKITQNDLIGNAHRLRIDDWKYQLGFLKSTRDAESWYQSPQVVDASFSVLMNAVELPAAFLQPPFFDVNADMAVNFGSIGAIVGHELGHAFDDQGSRFDGLGRIRNWWSPSALTQFKARSAKLVEQYSAYTPLPGLSLNGERTIGENMGDLTGLTIAHRAYQLFLDKHPKQKGIVRNGFTCDQRFFLAWGQTWRYVAPDSAIRHIVEYGYHSPAPYRVNGVVRNMDAWYRAFAVTPESKLFLEPSARVRLW